MSNLETNPEEQVCAAEPGRGIQILQPRDVPLGGPRAMVRPGELNLMTAGRGVQHSEVSTFGGVYASCTGA